MDFRGYRVPIHSGYSAYQRVHPDSTEHYGGEHIYSLCDLSLSDDQTPEDMPHWTGSPKRSCRSDSRTHDPKKPLGTLSRNQNPGIDVALRNLNHEVGGSLKMLQAFVQTFEAETEPLQDWATEYTLDTIWRNKVKDKCRQKRDKERFEGMTARIADSRATVKAAVKNAKIVKDLWDDRYKIEEQIRAAKKALLYADSIIGLAERATNERVACKQLLFELEETRCLLDRKKHPWIYGEDAIEKQAIDLGQMKSDIRSARKNKGEAVQRSTSSREGERRNPSDDGNGIETGKQIERAYAGDNRTDQPLDDSDDDLDGETW